MTFDYFLLPKREGKPRTKGLTMLIDCGLGLHAAEDLMMCHDWIDLIKIGWGSSLLYSKDILLQKIKIYKDNAIDVCPGGTLFELSYSRGMIEKFFHSARKMGFTAIEVSNGLVEIDFEEKASLIRQAVHHGFKVYSEIGKKNPIKDAKMTVEERFSEAKNDLEAGASKIILESNISGTVGIFDSNHKVREEIAHKLAIEIGVENIIFEAPRKNQTTWLILTFGPEVNVGNISPEDILSLESLRKGLIEETHEKIKNESDL